MQAKRTKNLQNGDVKVHIYFSLRPVGMLELPFSYNQIVQAAIYESIEPELATFLHEKGFESGNRAFKLFTFSRLYGEFEVDKDLNKIIFTNTINLVISSPFDRFCRSIINGILTGEHLRLGNYDVQVEKVAVQQFRVSEERVVLKTLSPIVAYSTFLRSDNRKYTCYFKPGEHNYNLLIENNLRKKYQAFYRNEAPAGEVKVGRFEVIRQNIINYKNFIIEGYSGKIEVTGPRELLQMAVDAGIGSKNSQGFGCVEII